MGFGFVKRFLPDRPVATRVLRGPFRGAKILMNPCHSIRKVLGLYEHELNGWIEQALHRVTCVLDVGANDGYFTFGCAAAFRRLHKRGRVISFEPQDVCVKTLRESAAIQKNVSADLEIVQSFVGRGGAIGGLSLDSVMHGHRPVTLIKIDVEGAEVDVVEGGVSWITSSNLFLIEVHDDSFIPQLKRIFNKRAHRLRQIDQQKLPLLKREAREKQNRWLVSELN